LVLVALVAVFVLIVAMQPADFSVQRSATMAAAPEKVFSQVNDFHNWEAWSPWAKIDPNSKTTFDGPSSGEGAIFKWAGNSEVGEGQMTITESKPNEVVKIKLEFIKPFEGTNQTEFVLAPAGSDTKVTWTMTGHNDFVSKAFCLLMDGKGMIAKDFDKGLANMKGVVEAPATSTDEPATTTEAATKPEASPDVVEKATQPASTEPTTAKTDSSEPAAAETTTANDAKAKDAETGATPLTDETSPDSAVDNPATEEEAK
jgi:hypothetical protein